MPSGLNTELLLSMDNGPLAFFCFFAEQRRLVFSPGGNNAPRHTVVYVSYADPARGPEGT